MPIKKAWQKHLRGLWQGIHGCGQGGKAPYPVTGSLRSFQEKNESANYIVLSRRKICAHCLKIYCIFPFLTELPSILCKGCCFNSPPRMHAPLNYTFSLLRSGKALKDVIDYVKDTTSLSYKIGTVPVFIQTFLTYMYRERIAHHGHAYKSVDSHSFAEAPHTTRFREKILNKMPGLCVAKSGRKVTLTVDNEVGWA